MRRLLYQYVAIFSGIHLVMESVPNLWKRPVSMDRPLPNADVLRVDDPRLLQRLENYTHVQIRTQMDPFSDQLLQMIRAQNELNLRVQALYGSLDARESALRDRVIQECVHSPPSPVMAAPTPQQMLPLFGLMGGGGLLIVVLGRLLKSLQHRDRDRDGLPRPVPHQGNSHGIRDVVYSPELRVMVSALPEEWKTPLYEFVKNPSPTSRDHITPSVLRDLLGSTEGRNVLTQILRDMDADRKLPTNAKKQWALLCEDFGCPIAK